MKRISFFLIGLTLIFGCAPRMNTPAYMTLHSPRPLPTTTKIVSVVSETLTEYGYTIALANEEVGTVTTDWYQKGGGFGVLGKRYIVSFSVNKTSNNMTLTLRANFYHEKNPQAKVDFMTEGWHESRIKIDGKPANQIKSIAKDIGNKLGIPVEISPLTPMANEKSL